MKRLGIFLLTFMLMVLVVGCVSDEKSIEFEHENMNILLNETIQLPLVLENVELEELEFEYDENIISLEGDIIIPLTLGSTTLIAKNGKHSATIEISVTFLKGNKDVLEIGQSVRIDLVTFTNRDDFNWEVQDPSIISFENYIAVALKPGITTITATNKADPSIVGQFDIEVILNKPDVSATIKNLQVGDQSQMIITNLDDIGTTNEQYNWEVSDDSIITIDENYLVTAHKVGTATVKVSLKENVKSFRTYEFNVSTPTDKKTLLNEPAEGPLLFEIDNPQGIVKAGKDFDFKIVGGNNNYNYRFRVQDMSVVAATDDGRIMGFKEGRTKVTIVSKTDITVRGEIYITVVGEPNVDYRERIVQAGLSEEGYTQGPNKKNKFGEWYEYDNVDWCAIFVSWCANQAGVGTNVINRYSLCIEGLRWYDEQGLYHLRGEHQPQRGDIIFFRNSQGRISHTGIVTGSNEYKVYTIEGNTSGGVHQREYYLTDSYVDGFATPNYPEFTK